MAKLGLALLRPSVETLGAPLRGTPAATAAATAAATPGVAAADQPGSSAAAAAAV